MGYQNAPATVTVTRDGQAVHFEPDYTQKKVAVYILGEFMGLYRNRTAAREALGLVEVPAKGR